MSNNHGKSRFFDTRITIFFSIAFGLALINVWYASRAIRLGSSSGGDDALSYHSSSLIHHRQVNDNSWRKDNFNFTVGICAIIKDGEAYLAEWLDYHLDAMGIEAIYIYDNSFGNPSLELEYDLQAWHRNTRSHPLYSKVEVMHMPEMNTGRQKRAYTDCVLRYGKNVPPIAIDMAEQAGYWNTSTDSRTLDENDGMDYLAFIDIDEFLVPKENYTSVHGVIKEYLQPFGGSLTVNWMLFGSSNKTLYSPIPVTKRFQYRDEMAHGVVKAIVQASDFGNMASPHAVNTLYGYRRTTLYKGAKLENEKGTSDPKLPSGVLLLYHYRYTSHKEYHYKKCIRMETDGMKQVQIAFFCILFLVYCIH